ncbi:hypothetical protein [Niabella hibiscisoli]|nr:hypothetical protein [Niabella hibiscisoli]MCH5716143.1 hypothetical protein [Niabella hibiscisoli]
MQSIKTGTYKLTMEKGDKVILYANEAHLKEYVKPVAQTGVKNYWGKKIK